MEKKEFLSEEEVIKVLKTLYEITIRNSSAIVDVDKHLDDSKAEAFAKVFSLRYIQEDGRYSNPLKRDNYLRENFEKASSSESKATILNDKEGFLLGLSIGIEINLEILNKFWEQLDTEDVDAINNYVALAKKIVILDKADITKEVIDKFFDDYKALIAA